ncbi:hypothetical protein [Chitinimonas sp. BJYL2]|uniref:hypothetical protein n=1 Tax=Chitinimonas sp. BJYL2 TaxID=2976696 RepID=UPI0022B5B639|nr:hypothetical protein [Chitinimonas sp. BJYL2]
MNTRLNTRFALVLLSLAGISAWAGNNTVTAGITKIVRGYNGGSPCAAATVGAGSMPSAGPKEDMSNLSVSCSDDKKVTWAQLREPLPNNHACVTTLDDLRKQNKYVTIVKDKTPDNAYHCVLSNITPTQFVNAAKHQQ